MSEDADDIILIEFAGERSGFQKASLEDALGQVKQHSQTALNLALGTIRSTAHRLNRTIREIQKDAQPDEVEVEFAVKLELEGGFETPQPVALVAKGTAGGQFTVKFKWALDRPQQAQVLVSTQP